MFKNIFTSKKRSVKNLLAIDITSGGLYGQIITLKNNRALTLKKNFLAWPKQSYTDLQYELNILTDLTVNLVKNLNPFIPNKEPLEVHVFLPTHYLELDTNILRYKPGQKIRITDKLIEKLITKHRDQFLNQTIEELKIIDDVVFSITLDDQIIESRIEGKIGENLAIHHFITATPLSLINRLTLNIAKSVNLSAQIFFHSRPLALYNNLKNSKDLPVKSDLILLDSSGETTDILTTKNNQLHQVGWAPIGKQTLVKRLAEITKTNLEDSYSEISLLASGLLDLKRLNEREFIIADLATEWVKQILDIVEPAELALIGIVGEDDISKILAKAMALVIGKERVFLTDTNFFDSNNDYNNFDLKCDLDSLFTNNVL